MPGVGGHPGARGTRPPDRGARHRAADRCSAAEVAVVAPFDGAHHLRVASCVGTPVQPASSSQHEPARPTTAPSGAARFIGWPRPVPAAAVRTPAGSRRPRRGSVSRNTAPRPRSPQACSQPLCSRASSRLIASPSPVPPVSRLRDGSPRQNRLNTSAASPGRRPDPVVAHRHRHRVVVGADPHLDRLALGVVEGVADQVAQHPLDPAGVHLGQHRLGRRDSPAQLHPVPGGQRLGWPPPPARRCRPGRPARSPGAPRRRRSARSPAGRPAGSRTGPARCSAARPSGPAPARSRPGWRTAARPAIRIVVSGVRSSCETSEVNRCCSRDSFSSRRICCCRLLAMSLKDSPSSAMSSSPDTAIRWARSPAASRSAVWAATRTGRTTWRVTSAAIAATSSTSARPATSTVCADQVAGSSARRSAGTGSTARTSRPGWPPAAPTIRPGTVAGLARQPDRRVLHRQRAALDLAAQRRAGSTGCWRQLRR